MKKILMGLLCGLLLLSACSKAEPVPEVSESPKAATEQTNETVYTDVFEEFIENAPIDNAYQRDLEQGEKVYADIVKDYHENWKAEYYGTKEHASLYFDEQAAKELSAHLENWEKELESGWNWQQEHYFLSDRSTYGTQVYDDQLKSLGDQYRAKSLWLKEMYYHMMKNDEDILAWHQDGFEFQVADGEVIIHRYCGEAETVEIPETLAGYPVRELWENSFYQCTGLREITLPQGLKKIGHSTFYRCYSLKKITLPASLEELGESAFFRCSSLEQIDVEEGNEHFASEDGVLYSKDMTRLLAYPEGKKATCFVFPASVTELDHEVFGYRAAALREITMPATLTKLPDYNVFVYPDEITLLVEQGSAAEQYAKTHELHYKLLD